MFKINSEKNLVILGANDSSVNLVSASIPLPRSAHLISTAVSLPGSSQEDRHDVQMMEMRLGEDMKPCISHSIPTANYKANVVGMDVDPMLMSIQTKSELG